MVDSGLGGGGIGPSDRGPQIAGCVDQVLAIVNDLLTDAGATIRVFTLHAGGNEGAPYCWTPGSPLQ